MTIAQALHGYAEGHRLLASSPGVSAAVLRRLDRMTDLTGYLPSGLRFEVYHTGFPTPDGYALSATWLDERAPRAGAVLTHTLLIPPALIDDAPDPWALGALHRRPHDAYDRAPYEQPLALTPIAPCPSTPPRRELLALYFREATRPVLWTGDGEAIVPDFWRFLWPGARSALRFCTFALQPLRDGEAPFDLLALPRAATSAFHGLVGHPWFKPHDPALPSPAWLEDLLVDGGGPMRQRVIAWADETGRPVRPEQIPLLVRLEATHQRMADHLPAARTFVDLLARLDPDGHHPLWGEGFQALIDRQGDAPLEPRPLWDLRDLLGRPRLADWLARSPALGIHIEQTVERVLADRLQVRPALAAPALPAVFDAWRALTDPARAEALIARVLPPDRAAIEALFSVAASADDALADAILRPQASAARLEIVRAAALEPDRVRALAERLADPGLLVACWPEAPTTHDLRAVAAAWREAPRAERLGPLLKPAPALVRLEWALSAEEEEAIEVGVEAAREAGLAPADLAPICALRSNGPAIFAQVTRSQAPSVIAAALADHPTLAEALLPDARGLLLEALVSVLPLPILLERAAFSPSTLGHDAGQRLALGLVRAVSDGAIALELATRWLTGLRVQRIIDGLKEADLRRALSGGFGPWLRLLLHAPEVLGDRGGRRILMFLFEQVSTSELDACATDLIRLLDVRTAHTREIAMLTAHATRRLEPRCARELLMRTFRTVHSGIRKDHWLVRALFWPFGERKEDDEWVRWLADLWRRRGWSKADLAQCAGKNAALRQDLLERFDSGA